MYRLAELRRERRMTQTELARMLNVSDGAVSMYESGKRQPTFEMLLKICEIFGCTIDYLLDRSADGADRSQFILELSEIESGLTDDDQNILVALARHLARREYA